MNNKYIRCGADGCRHAICYGETDGSEAVKQWAVGRGWIISKYYENWSAICPECKADGKRG